MASSKITFFFVALLMSPVIPHDDKVRCTQDQLQCVTVPQCIHSDWRFDGEADCEDRSDERECCSPWWTEGAVVAGGAVVVAATQVAVAVLGFGVAGLGAGTWTAGSVSRPLTLGVGLGVVSTLQVTGATGTHNHSHVGVGAGEEEGFRDHVFVGDGHHNLGEDELQDED